MWQLGSGHCCLVLSFFILVSPRLSRSQFTTWTVDQQSDVLQCTFRAKILLQKILTPENFHFLDWQIVKLSCISCGNEILAESLHFSLGMFEKNSNCDHIVLSQYYSIFDTVTTKTKSHLNFWNTIHRLLCIRWQPDLCEQPPHTLLTISVAAGKSGTQNFHPDLCSRPSSLEIFRKNWKFWICLFFLISRFWKITSYV